MVLGAAGPGFCAHCFRFRPIVEGFGFGAQGLKGLGSGVGRLNM